MGGWSHTPDATNGRNDDERARSAGRGDRGVFQHIADAGPTSTTHGVTVTLGIRGSQWFGF
jgi:hypothetical protein